MKKDILKFTCILFALAFMSCSGDDENKDSTAPTATLIAPVEQQLFLRGNTMFFTAQFSDNIGLKECTVYLSEGSLKTATGWDDPWQPAEQTFSLSGTTDKLENEILFEPSIPLDIKSTNYILNVLVVDLDLNYTKYEIPIQIK